ncbi:efflux RND transporter periplasmic adaptor subunit [Candidatus Fermentibacteria bacterium]|nr:efflux RND transporter periplasmic adaptor subunit [Candidatus Fermentibacteria bacterium]
MMRGSFLFLSLVLMIRCGGNHGGTIRASGHIEATDVRVAAKVGGRLAAVLVQEGDSVQAGQLVAQIDTVDAALELARAQAELARADAQLRLLEAGSRREDLTRATEEVARAEAELHAAQRDLARLETLASQGAATPKALDDARTRRDIADRSFRAVRAAQERVATGARVEEVDMARAQRDAAQAMTDAVAQRRADTEIRSPLRGVVTVRAAEPGEIIPPGGLICVVSDLANPWLVVYLDEPSLGRVRLRDTVEVRVDGVDEAMAGVLIHVASVAEFTPKNVQTPHERAKLVYKAKVLLQNPVGTFKPGMPADAIFTAQEGRGS